MDHVPVERMLHRFSTIGASAWFGLGLIGLVDQILNPSMLFPTVDNLRNFFLTTTTEVLSFFQ